MRLGFSGNRRLCGAVIAAACLLMAAATQAGYTLTGYEVVDQGGPSASRIDVVLIGDGYTVAEMDTFWPAKVSDCMYFFRNVEPYRRYYKFMNFYQVNVISNETGSDMPDLGIYRDTALNTTVNQYAHQTIDYVIANQIIAEALAGTGIIPEIRVCPVNVDRDGATDQHGYALYTVGGGRGANVVIHEIGHSYHKLFDEYDDNDPDKTTTYMGPEPTAINVTIDPTGAKWAHWIGYDDPLYPIVGPIGVFEGGNHCDAGIYRPSRNAKMRTPSRPYDAVCREKIIQDMYSKVRPMDACLSNATALSDPRDLWVQVVDPDILRVQWFINDVLVPGLGDQSFRVSDLDMAPGHYTIRARAYDPTDWVRTRLDLLEQSVTWTVDLTFTAYRPAWQPQQQAATINPLQCAWGSGPGDLFVGGSAGTMLRYDGAQWQAMASGTGNPLYGLWGSSPANVMAVGSAGTVVRYNGTNWTAMTSGTSNTLRSIWGSASDDVFAVGYSGTIMRYNGTSWSLMTSGTTNHLYGVWGSGPKDVFAVGYNGTIVHYNGTNWQAMTSGTTNHLYAVWGNRTDNVFAVGSSGTILRYDGTTWQAMASGVGSHLYSLWGSGGTNVIAAGFNGTILRFNGLTWQPMTSGTTGAVRAVWGSGHDDIYAVGDAGTVLHLALSPAGDINTDGHVDNVDVVRLSEAWGAAAGESTYDAYCDLDGDGVVDVSDLLLQARSFGS